jgi:hypothetical protein
MLFGGLLEFSGGFTLALGFSSAKSAEINGGIV